MYIDKQAADEIFYDATTEGVLMQQLLRVLWLRNQIGKATKLIHQYNKEVDADHLLSNNFYLKRLDKMTKIKARLEKSYKLALGGLSLQSRTESNKI